MTTLKQKALISITSAIMFAFINSPDAYTLTNKYTSINTYDSKCPTNTGLLVHALVFLVLTYLSMGGANVNEWIKFKHSLYGALIFFFISSPSIYTITGYIFGPQIADADGCPTTYGILLHAAVYCVALIGVMYLPERNK